KVMFLGIRSDVPALMQALDLFVLPSWFEGLPMVGIEAQISGLPCYFSDKITTEARIREDSEFLPIEKGAKYWADKMADLYNHPANRESNFLETGYQFSLKEQETVLRNIINEP
ncbi:MAG: glycosyltransferase, partial [Lachnospiraceae bacterium]